MFQSGEFFSPKGWYLPYYRAFGAALRRAVA
jgi:hypothetical protein